MRLGDERAFWACGIRVSRRQTDRLVGEVFILAVIISTLAEMPENTRCKRTLRRAAT